MFGIGPAYLFLLQHRLPVGLMRGGWQRRGSAPWRPTSAMALHRRGADLADRRRAVPAGAPADHAAGGLDRACGCSTCSTSSRTRCWDAQRRAGTCTRPRCTAARTTSCRRVLRWFTANIGVHHVHHLCSRIPYYRLPQVLRDHPELDAIGRLTLLGELQMRAAGAVGREAAGADVVPRAAPAARRASGVRLTSRSRRRRG